MLGDHQNVESAEDAGLLGHSDADHFAYCWRHRKVLVTHDFDFLDEENLPDTRNPGVVVFNCDSRDEQSVARIIALLPRLRAVIGEAGWRHTRSVVSADGKARVRRSNSAIGKERTDTFRFTPQGHFEPVDIVPKKKLRRG